MKRRSHNSDIVKCGNKRNTRAKAEQNEAPQTPCYPSSSASSASSAGFKSCLDATADVVYPTDLCGSPRSVPSIVLKRALSLNELDDESWLSSSFLDLIVAKFSKCYSAVRYLSVDFALLVRNMTDTEQLTDIRGRVIDYKDTRSPIVFVFNSNNIHWNLIRVLRTPEPELQLFEPMGMPHNRHGGLNYRSVPREIVHWLDTRCPLPDGRSWIAVGHSAIDAPHQLTSYDCGVACLLYAEKCGLGESKDSINTGTTQDNITSYRKLLQRYMEKVGSTMD